MIEDYEVGIPQIPGCFTSTVASRFECAPSLRLLRTLDLLTLRLYIDRRYEPVSAPLKGHVLRMRAAL
jgi:hypothetical protein